MRFCDLPMEYKRIALDHLYQMKLQDVHANCAHRATQRRIGAYSSWEQNRNCQDIRLISLDGYCDHGMWVGGCGIDWMCHMCENGTTLYEWALSLAFAKYGSDQRKRNREESERLLDYFNEVTYDTNNPEHRARLEKAMTLAYS